MNFRYLWTFLTFWSIFFCGVNAQPTATIVSDDISFCELGTAELQILFEGEAPFGIVYKIVNLETGGSSIQMELNKDIFANDLVNGVWTTTTISITDTSRIELIEVFDNSVPSNEWVYTLSDNGHGSIDVSGSMTVNVDQRPVPDAGLFSPQCGYVAPLNATLSKPGRTMYWSDVVGGKFDDNTIPNAKFIAETQGTYTLTLTEVNGTCSATDDITVELWGSPQATVSGSQVICSNDGNPYSLNITTELKNGLANYSYKVTDGITEYSRNNKSTLDEFSVPATKEATWKVVELFDARGCQAHIDSIKGEATVVDKKPNPNAGLTDIWCEGDLNKGYILGAQLDKGEGGVWLDHANIRFSEADNPTAVAKADGFGTYTLSWQETYGGCSDIATVDITFINPPTLNVLQPDISICKGSEALLRTSASSDYFPLMLTYSDGSNQAVSLASGYQEIKLTPTETTNYKLLELTDSKGCSNPLTSQFNVTVDFVPNPMPGVYDAICGNVVQLNAILGNDEAGSWSSVYGIFSDKQSPASEFTIDLVNQEVQEVHTLNWTVVNKNNPNCVSKESVDITFDKVPTKVFAGRDTTIYKTDQLEISATGLEAGMTGVWSSGSGDVVFSNEAEPQGTASNIPEGMSELIWIISNGACEDVESVMKVNRKPLTNPNGFSPNGDEINDYFRIGGADKIANNKFIVFDLNGKVVFQKNNLDENGWDGNGLDGSKLANGTYYYIFTGDDGVDIREYLIIKNTK